MSAQIMPRVPLNLRIDDRLIEGFKSASQKAGLSLNAYMEQLLLGHLKGVGEIPIDTQPLEDSRGGKRSGAGKKKRSSTDEEPIATDKENLSTSETTDEDCL